MNNIDLEKSSNKKIIKGSMVAYLSLVVNIFAGIVYTPWMVRQIGQSNYGLYTLAVSITSILMFDFGIGSALTRFAAQYRAKEDRQGLEKFFGLVYKLYLLIDAVVLIICSILFFFLGCIYTNFTAAELNVFRVVYIMVVSYNLLAFPFTNLDGILGAYEEFSVLKGCELFTRILTIFLVVISLLNNFGLYALVLSNIIGGLVSVAIKWYFVQYRLRIFPHWGTIDIKLLKSVMSFSIWSAVSSISTTIGTGLMPSVIAACVGASEVAIYGAANTLNGYAYLLTNAIGGMFLPKISRIQLETRASDKLDVLAVQVGRILGLFSMLIYAGFFCVGEEFFVLWMGKLYRPAYQCACFLLFAELAFTPFHIYDTALVAKGIIQPQAILRLGTAVGILLVSIPLVVSFGAIGAGIAISFGYTIRSIGNMILYQKYLKVLLPEFIRSIYSKMFLYIVIMIMLRGALGRFIAHSWLLFFLKCAVIVVGYLVITIFFFLNENEKSFILRAIKKRDQ